MSPFPPFRPVQSVGLSAKAGDFIPASAILARAGQQPQDARHAERRAEQG